MASCCILFEEAKLLIIASLLPISLVNPSKSLVKAKNLALSKFNCLPVRTSASNSACMELSMSNRFPAISFTCCKDKPYLLASITAAPIFSTEVPKDTAISLDTLAVWSKIF